MGAQGVQSAFDVLVAAVNLLDVVDGGRALGAHGGEQHGDTGTDIRRHQPGGLQGNPMVVADDHRPVRVAEDNLRAHVDEAVHEEQAALEHLLVDEHAALALGGHHQHHGQEVRRKAGPGGIGQGHDGTVQERVNLIAVLLRDKDVIPLLLQLDAQAPESVRNDAQVIIGGVFDGKAALADGGHADEGAHLNHVGEDLVQGAVQGFHAVNPEEVGTHAVDEGAHAVEHLAQLLEVRFAGGVVDGGGALGQHGGHHNIGRTGDGSLVQEHVSARQAAFLRQVECAAGRVVGHFGAQLHHAVQVGVYTPAADFIPAGLGEPGVAEAREQRAHHHHGATEFGALGHEFLGLDVGRVHGIGLEGIHALGQTRDLHAHVLQQLDEVLHIQDLRDVADGHGFAGEEYGADDFQGLVFGSLRGNAAGQLVSAFDDKLCHNLQI